MATTVDTTSNSNLLTGPASPAPDDPTAGPRPGTRVTRRRVYLSEWIKLRTVRSTTVGLGMAALAAVLLGVMFSSIAGSGGTTSGTGPGPAMTSNDPVALSLAGFHLTQLIVGVLGVLVVTAEYSTGMIRTTFSAVTRRLSVLEAKAVVFGGVTLGVMAVVAFIAFFAGQAVYTGSGVTAAITDSGVLRAVLGTAVYTAGIGLMGIALGFLLRSSAAGVGVLLAGILVIPLLVGLVPGTVGDWLYKLLPSQAGAAFTSVTSPSALLSPGAGALVFGAWLLALLLAAAVVVRGRDA